MGDNPSVRTDPTLAALLEELAAPHPSPGSGSALALALAAAAAVVEMCGRVSARSWPDGAGAAAQAALLRERATALVQEDADAYSHALEARKATADLPPERRDFEVGRAFAAAAEPPLELARIAADLAELARVAASQGSESVQPDAAAAAALAAGVAQGARGLVAVNLTALPDDRRVAEADRLSSEAEQASEAARG